MPVKRLNVELPLDQFEFLRKEAAAQRTSMSGLLRLLIEESRARPPETIRQGLRDDPFSGRRGSFDGPPHLAEDHDKYLYGAEAP